MTTQTQEEIDRTMNWPSRWLACCGQPIPAYSLAVVRILFGAVLFYEALWFLGVWPGAQDDPNRIELLFTGPDVARNIAYPLMSWLPTPGEPWMSVGFVVMALASLAIFVGIGYRLAMIYCAVFFSYVNLVESAVYLNHFYLTCLLAWMLACMPADRVWSWRWWRQGATAWQVGAWTIGCLRAQWVLVYAFAGLAKCNSDWLAGEPLRTWLQDPALANRLGEWIGVAPATMHVWLSREPIVMTLAWGGMLFDCLIGPMLLWSKTRKLGLVLCVGFHVTNSMLFDIGAFPWLALGMTTIFLQPDWPRRLLQRVAGQRLPTLPASGLPMPAHVSPWLLGVVVIWFGIQLTLPVRHYFISGNVQWTEEGHRFSWRMKLRTKDPGLFLVQVVPGTDGLLPESSADDSWDGVEFLEVNRTAVPWTALPSVMTTFEPLIGERIWFQPTQRGRLAQLQKLQIDWGTRYRAEVQFAESVTMSEVFGSLREEAQRRSDLQVQRLLDLGWTQYEKLRTCPPDSPEQYQTAIHFQRTLYSLIQVPGWKSRVLNKLILTPPFALQGSEQPAPGVLIFSKQLQTTDGDVALRIRRDLWQENNLVVCDFHGFCQRTWKGLPDIIATSQVGGGQVVYWNAGRDLHTLQYRNVSTSPLLQEQYVRQIADDWRDATGERPQVFVTSHVKLNHHPVQPMVDSQCDLATSRPGWLGHRDWILALQKSTPEDRRVALGDRAE